MGQRRGSSKNPAARECLWRISQHTALLEGNAVVRERTKSLNDSRPQGRYGERVFFKRLLPRDPLDGRNKPWRKLQPSDAEKESARKHNRRLCSRTREIDAANLFRIRIAMVGSESAALAI